MSFLCLPHHDEYDGKPSQSKRWAPKELTESKNKLTEFIEKNFDKLSPEFETSKPIKRTRYKKNNKEEKRQIITPEVYNLRISIYNAYRDLIVKILRDTKIDLQDCVGQHVTVVASPRNNNDFAFPAYFALSVR